MGYHKTETKKEKAVLVGIVLPQNRRWEVEENLSELKQLAATSGVEIIDQVVQERQQIHPATFIGRGKVEELVQLVEMHKVKSIIFDDDLTPAQSRNLEKTTNAKIIDRSQLILDIFANHARTRAAKTQVELAQLQYMLPRLTRQWTHLSRQVGGIGTKGPGETQLETDRRLVRTRIQQLRKELKKIDSQRQTRRKSREKVFSASLVGYTNVGKSTIINLLSGSDVLVENQLFATLDSTTRQVVLDKQHTILMSDTVGFIRKLPHHLIESFKSTLDEALDADLLVHVVDVSHPAFNEHIHIVNGVLESIGAKDKPVLMVFNKIDKLKEKEMLTALSKQYPESVFISAVRQIRTKQLKELLSQFMEKNFVESSIEVPIGLSRIVNKIHELAVVSFEKYTDTHVHLTFKCNPENREKINRHLQKLTNAMPAV